MQVQALYAAVTQILRAPQTQSLPKANFELEANWIVEHFTELAFLDRVKNPNKEISEVEAEQALEAARRIRFGEPLAYVLGYKDFFGLKFQVNPSVLIPRPETELLVEWALEWLQDHTLASDESQVLELGTGSGCISIALAKNFSEVKIAAVEKSVRALEIAKNNALAHGAQNKISFFNLDAIKINEVFGKRRFDLILANPPYIDPDDPDIETSVKTFEPAEALFAAGGLSAIRDWLSVAAPLLKPKAALGFEIGAKQGDTALKLMRDLNVFSKQYVLQDLSGRDRFICGER